MRDWNVPYNPEPVGSPAYVRELRDQAAMARFARIRGGSGLLKEDIRSVVRSANFLVEQLGYQVPEDES